MVMRTTFAQDAFALLGLLGAVVGLLIGEGLDTGRSNRNALCGVLTECSQDRTQSLVLQSGPRLATGVGDLAVAPSCHRVQRQRAIGICT